MKLPQNINLPIDKLTKVFKSTSASYKYFWFLAILDLLNQNTHKLSFAQLNIQMIALAWRMVNVHKLNFGKQDKLAQNIEAIIAKSKGKINEDSTKKEVGVFLRTNYGNFKNEIDFLNKQVPYFFLSPFVGTQQKKSDYPVISQLAFDKKCHHRIKLWMIKL